MTGNWFIHAAYLAVAVVFILGLKAMASPATARKGIVWAGYAMVAAVVVTLFWPGMENRFLIVLGILVGGIPAWRSGKSVAMTDMPQMVAIYNGMGGGAAAGIAAIELVRGVPHDAVTSTLLALGAVIGAVAFSGSCVAFAKLQGLMTKAIRLPGQNNINFLLSVITIGIGLTVASSAHPGGFEIFRFFVLALALGVILVMPSGGADICQSSSTPAGSGRLASCFSSSGRPATMSSASTSTSGSSGSSPAIESKRRYTSFRCDCRSGVNPRVWSIWKMYAAASSGSRDIRSTSRSAAGPTTPVSLRSSAS